MKKENLTMSEDLVLFNSPRLQYLRMRRDFLERFMNKNVWGEFGSKEHLIAVSDLLEYFKKTKCLAEDSPQLSSEVIFDNKNLVLQGILSFPQKLYEQLVEAAVGEDGQLSWEPSVILTRFENFLLKMRRACLLAYEDRVCSEVNNYENYTSDTLLSEDSAELEKVIHCDQDKSKSSRTILRKYRNKIYARLRSNQSVRNQMRKYKSLTETFIQNFGTELSVEEVNTFRNRLERTKNSVRFSKLNHRKQLKQNFESQRKVSKVGRVKPVERSRHEDEKNKNVLDEIELPITDDQIKSEMNPQLLNIQEQDILILPDVPPDTNENVLEVEDTGPDLDDEIQKRLTRLKFFSRVWCEPPVTDTEVSLGAAGCETIREEESEENPTEAEEIVPVTSTESDRKEFNRWYYNQIDKVDLAAQSEVIMATTNESLDNVKNLFSVSEVTSTIEYLDNLPFSQSDQATMSTASDSLDMLMDPSSDPNNVTETQNAQTSSICQTCKLSKEEMMMMWIAEEDGLHFAISFYQNYLVGLVTVCSFISAQLTLAVDEPRNPSLTSLPAPPTHSLASAPCSVTSPGPRDESTNQMVPVSESKGNFSHWFWKDSLSMISDLAINEVLELLV